MKDSRGFIVFWLANSAIFYFAPFVFGSLVVSGNARLAPFMASVVSGFLVTIADALTLPLFERLGIELRDEWQWTLAYLFVNVLSIWVIARYADLTGVGIQNAWVAVLLGVIFNVVQWIMWRTVFPKRK